MSSSLLVNWNGQVIAPHVSNRSIVQSPGPLAAAIAPSEPPFQTTTKRGRRGGSGGHSLHDAAATKTCGTIKVSITLFLLCPITVG